MRISIIVLTHIVSFSSFAQKGVKYDYCQDAINKTFNIDSLVEKQANFEEFEAGKPYKNEKEKLERLNELYRDKEYITEGHPGSKTNKAGSSKPLFKIDEYGKLVPDEKLVTISLFNEQTGEYNFRIKGSESSNAIALGKFVVKKDEQGRIFSIEEQGNDLRCKKCVRKLELSYSKKKCVPKRIVSVDLQKNIAVITDAEVCKNLDDIQKQLYKKMSKMDKCMNALNEHYQTTAEVSELMLSNVIDSNEAGIVDGNFSNYLQSINSLSKELKEKDQEFELRYEKQRMLQKQYDDLLDQCTYYLGKDVVNTKSVYKKKSGIFEIKKESIGNQVDDPYAGTVIKE